MSEIFKRYEKKYLLDDRQYVLIKEKIRDYTVDDVYRDYDLMSVYYDNENDELIRRSVEKPLYKEKLRIRAYVPPKGDDRIQVELKKKYDGIVYKRRTTARYCEVLGDIYRCAFADEQIGKEIAYFLKYHAGLRPKIYIGCHRTSFKGKTDSDLRITFDEDMVYRTENVRLAKDIDDRPLTEGVIMEIKVSGSVPIWLTKILDEVKARPQGFSKVGRAYMKEKENAYG